MAHDFLVTARRCPYCAFDQLNAAHKADDIALEKLTRPAADPNKPPRIYRCRLTKPRNPLVHNLYFAAIASAAKRWPDNLEPQPEGNEKLLRAWLQCKAGYCTRKTFPLAAKDAVIWLLGEVRADDKFAFVKEVIVDGEPHLGVFIPDSIAYEELDDIAFAPIKDAVFARIEDVFGMDVKALIKLDATAEA